MGSTAELNLELRAEVISVILPYLSNLRKLQTEYIGYREFYSDGTSIAFCSNDQWYDVAMDRNLMLDMSKHYTQELLTLAQHKFNYIVRTTSNTSNKFLEELAKNNMCNSLLIYRIHRESVKMYSFIAPISNMSALNNFFNKKPLFEALLLSFQEKVEQIFCKDKYKKLKCQLIPVSAMNRVLNFNSKGYESYSNYDLTVREIECMQLLAASATNKDIAKRFNISPRTVEYHISNIKKKLKVCSRFEIQEFIKVQF